MRHRLIFVSVYPSSQASTRLRGEQFRPFLKAEDIELVIWSFIPNRLTKVWFEGNHLSRLGIFLLGLLRALYLPLEALKADVAVIHREAMPFGPPVLEQWIAKRRPLIWDVDDCVWVAYPSLFLKRLPAWFRKPAGKYEKICAASVQVWAGSEVLAAWCRPLNEQTHVIPTVVEVPANNPSRSLSATVGWIGSPSTGSYLQGILGSVDRVYPKVKLLVTGCSVQAPSNLLTEITEWSPNAERRILSEISVGLYPIDRGHPLAEGKACLKAILYMSQGIPTVVTPTVTNALIVRDGIEGLHADSDEAWTSSVERLMNDEEFWRKCSQAAHERAKAYYSLEVWGPRLADLAKQVVRS